MKAINYACIKLEEEAARSVKKIKTILSTLYVGNKFTMRITGENLTILLYKKLFSCIN